MLDNESIMVRDMIRHPQWKSILPVIGFLTMEVANQVWVVVEGNSSLQQKNKLGGWAEEEVASTRDALSNRIFFGKA